MPGFAKGQVGGWDEALVFYYLAARNLALPFLPAESRPLRREQIVRRLLATQAPDGTWSNASPRMREDDPLIATALAVVTLAKSS